MDENYIGRWGEAWQKFMRENYPDEAAELQKSERWTELACEVEREAMDLRDLLRSQLRTHYPPAAENAANPRPTDFMETVKWAGNASLIP